MNDTSIQDDASSSIFVFTICETTEDAYTVIDEYKTSLILKKRRERTCDEYWYRVRMITRFLESCSLEDPEIKVLPQDIGVEEINLIIDVLLKNKSDNYQSETVRIYSKFLRTVSKNNIVKDMDLLWPEIETDVTWVTPDQMIYIQEHARGMDKLLVHLAGEGGGIRCEELAEIKLSDITDKRIIIRGKGHLRGKRGKIEKHEDTQGYIDEYIKNTRDRVVEIHKRDHPDVPIPDNLFLHSRGGVATPYSRKTIGNRFTKLAKRLNMDFSAHSFRRGYCTMLEIAQVPAPTISRMMRHKKFEDTKRYLAKSPLKVMQARLKQKEFMDLLKAMPPEKRLEYCIGMVDEHE